VIGHVAVRTGAPPKEGVDFLAKGFDTLSPNGFGY
jgi:hypothetical protein